MAESSTLLLIIDGSEGVSEFINVNEMLDPFGKCSQELEITLKSINFSPREELITNILMNA